MKIGVIQASSQADKNELIYSTVRKYAPEGSEVINFGCTPDEKNTYSYVDISVLIGLLLSSEAVDFVVTGCSSGQGMMLACNSMPGVLCGYAPTPRDAWLFAQINDGNCISLPLGEAYTWTGTDNFDRTIAALFSEPFGGGYPKSEAERKRKDTETLKRIRKASQARINDLMKRIDPSLVENIQKKQDVMQYISMYGRKELTYITVREQPEIKTAAAQWFHDQWGVPTEAYLECMDACLDGTTQYDWYLCLDEDRIVGGLGVIENDFHDRKDLAPNICAVYTDEKYRGRGIAGNLLNMAVKDMRSRGITPVYLVTDHTGFYERYGWEFLCMVQGDGEPAPSKLYIHR